jgi:cold shock CspA family protein
MSLTGTLRTWNDDRGFGFIAPRDGGRELFVHVSAFPRDGSRPTVGETLTYEVGAGKDGKPRVVKVYRRALDRPADYPRSERRRTQPSRVPVIMAVLIVLAIAAYGYRAYHARAAMVPSSPGTARDAAPTSPREAGTAFRCDGRTHCSQMTSCAEAKFFLNHCPGKQMDGNHDGVPCELQWCTGPSAP